MRRACISIGRIECDDCHRIVPFPGRYLAIDEADDSILRLCIDCALKKGHARYKSEKGDSIVTFYEEPENASSEL